MLNKNEDGKIFTVEGFIAEQKEVIDVCLKGKASVEKGDESMKNAVLWGKEISLKNSLAAYRNPGRPSEYSR